MAGGFRAAQSGDEVPGTVAHHPLSAVAGAPGQRVAAITVCRTCDTAVDKKVFSLNCRTCGELLVRYSDLAERAQPDGLLPFEIDENIARAAFATWVSSRRFAPRTLKTVRQPGSVDGVFLPFWIFSSNTTSRYTGERGETRHRQVRRSRTNSDGETEWYWDTERYTEWYGAAGEVSRRFDGLVVPACSPLAKKIPDWPMDRAVPFTAEAADGKRVIAYDVEPEEGFERAGELMVSRIEDDVRADIGGDDQRVDDVRTTYVDPSYTLAVLPAWLVSYSHDKRTWSALVNGTTGEVVGERPYSPAKILLLAAVLALAVAVVVALVARH
jgi:hypothetical protein